MPEPLKTREQVRAENDAQASRAVYWPQLLMGAVCLAIAGAYVLVCLEVLPMPPPAGGGPVARWLPGAIGVGTLVLGLNWLGTGLFKAFTRRRLPGEGELLSDLVAAATILAILAIGLTYAAAAAWFPELGGAFEGGWTGSIWEHRIAWTVAAVIVDAFAIPFCLVAMLGLLGTLGRAVKRLFR